MREAGIRRGQRWGRDAGKLLWRNRFPRLDRVKRSWFHRSGCGWNSFGRRCLNSGDGGDEAVAHADDGLDELRIVGIVAEKVPELTDSCIDAVFGIDEDFARPEPFGDLGASDELTFSRGKQDEQLHGLTLYAQGVPVTEELERSAVQPEVAEMIDEAAQGSSCGGNYDPVSQEKARFKRGWRFTKTSPPVHLLSIAQARIAVQFRGQPAIPAKEKRT